MPWLLHTEEAATAPTYTCYVYRPAPPLLPCLHSPAHPLPRAGAPLAASLARAWLPHWRLRLLLCTAAAALPLHCLLAAAAPLRALPPPLLLALAAALALALARACLPRRVIAERLQAHAAAGLACSQLHEDGSERQRAPLPRRAIASVVLNEGFQACSVRYYLAAVVRGQGELFLPLLVAQPRLPVLTAVLAALSERLNAL
jgi:hypothetical protein